MKGNHPHKCRAHMVTYVESPPKAVMCFLTYLSAARSEDAE